MKVDEFKAITTKIAQNLSNQGLVTELLTQLNDDYTTESTNRDNLTTQTGELQEQIKGLQTTNMNLFLKLGNPVPDKVVNSEKTMSYDDLLNNWDKK